MQKANDERIRILMVDDEIDFLHLTARALERRGFQVLQAASGQDAVMAVRGHEIDVAVLDVRMPDADGHELYYELKRRRPDMEVVILTGHGDIRKAFELSKHGVVEYLTKPCDIEELASVIRLAYAKKRRARIAVVGPTSEASPPGGPVRVLLVDDEEDFLAFVKRGLSRCGYDVVTARTGLEGLEELRKGPVDVAVVDLEMPGIDGLETLYRIKREHPMVEVILLTGHATIQSAIRGLKEGAADYLTKPQSIDELAAKVADVARKKRAMEAELVRRETEEQARRNPS